jgi:hypothetical protein
MPIYLYDQGDFNSQFETYELERLARMRTRVALAFSIRWCGQMRSCVT